VITSWSPTDRFETCGSGTYFSGIWFPECGGHLPGRQNSAFLRGCRPGGPKPGRRARPSVTGGPGRLAGVLPRVGPGGCPGHRWQEPLRIVGASPPRARWYASLPWGGLGGGSGGGGRVAGAGLANRARWGKQGGAEYGALAPLVGLSRGPTWRSHPRHRQSVY